MNAGEAGRKPGKCGHTPLLGWGAMILKRSTLKDRKKEKHVREDLDGKVCKFMTDVTAELCKDH